MVFWFVAIIVALLLILISMQINAFISWEKENRVIINQLTSVSETYYTKEITDGPIKNCLLEITQKLNLPASIKIFSSSGVTFLLPSLNIGFVAGSTAFTLSILTNRSKSCIFVPKEWLENLTDEEMKSLLCHEICHVIRAWKYKVIQAVILVHINPWVSNLCKKLRTIEEIEADAFAAKMVGKKTYAQFYKKMIKKYPRLQSYMAQQRIAKLESKT